MIITRKQAPTFLEEERLQARGYRFIAGVDEVGRGTLAGPVVAAAAILLAEKRPPWLSRVRDSKQLTARQRQDLSRHILAEAVATGIGAVSPETIDRLGIVPATRLAMRSAIEQLRHRPDFLLIDAVRLPEVKLPQHSIVKGDQLVISISAASIIAKVYRDQVMVRLDSRFPGYGFARHKGYCTPEHVAALHRLGPCSIHRKTFAPVEEVTQKVD